MIIASVFGFARLMHRLGVLLRILELIHEALSDNVVVSKRSVIANFRNLFLSENITDNRFA